MRVEMLTKEWPPENYGGAGVHVEHLVGRLREMIDVQVQCFGRPRRMLVQCRCPTSSPKPTPHYRPWAWTWR